MSDEKSDGKILVVTCNTVQGYEIQEVLGLVYGSSVRARTITGNIVGQMRAMIGGKQKGYIRLVNQARDEALSVMTDNAKTMGATAILEVRFDSGQFDSDANNKGSMQETTAYGTAVILQKRGQIADSSSSEKSGA